MSIKNKRNVKRKEPKPPERIWTDKKKYPNGVIKADTSKQAPNGSYGPPYFYQDRNFSCRDCEKEEIWTAEQQWMYFEVWRKPIYGIAVRCRECRIKRRKLLAATKSS